MPDDIHGTSPAHASGSGPAQPISASTPAKEEQKPHGQEAADGRAPTSEKQVEANRRNAERSTGPVTPAGKAAVAQNAYKHGAYSADTGYVHRGPSWEDPAHRKAVEDAIVQSLAPSNEALKQATNRLARAITVSSGFARHEQVFRAQAGDVDVTDPELGAGCPFPRSPHHDHPWIVLARAVTDEDFVRDCQMTELAPEYPHVDWEALAYHVIRLLEPKNPLVDEEAADPPAGTDWRTALEQTLRAHFTTPTAAKAWVREYLRTSGITALQRQAADVAAARVLTAIDKTSRTGARVDWRVASALKDYKTLLEIFKGIQPLENAP